jgi:hypothetical protein
LIHINIAAPLPPVARQDGRSKRLSRFRTVLRRRHGRVSGSQKERRQAVEDQQRIAAHMRQSGHRFEVVDSVERAIGVLVDWNVMRSMMVQ